jgi:hypothetical protein
VYVEHYHAERNHRGIDNRLIAGPALDLDDRSCATLSATWRTPQFLCASGVIFGSARSWNITGSTLETWPHRWLMGWRRRRS